MRGRVQGLPRSRPSSAPRAFFAASATLACSWKLRMSGLGRGAVKLSMQAMAAKVASRATHHGSEDRGCWNGEGLLDRQVAASFDWYVICEKGAEPNAAQACPAAAGPTSTSGPAAHGRRADIAATALGSSAAAVPLMAAWIHTGR